MILWKSQIRSCTPFPSNKKQTVYWSGLTIGIGALRGNYAHMKIRESLLGSAGVGRCPVLSNRCVFGLANQKSGKYISATELEIIRFRPLPLGELMWQHITKLNGGILAAYITVFDMGRGKCRRFNPFLVYALVYPSIASKLVTLDNLIPWYDSVCTYTCHSFLRKPLLR